jgi:hypothetical protein
VGAVFISRISYYSENRTQISRKGSSAIRMLVNVNIKVVVLAVSGIYKKKKNLVNV